MTVDGATTLRRRPRAFRPEAAVDVALAQSLRERTPGLLTFHASAQPAVVWEWGHQPDRFGNVEAAPPEYAADVVMSDITLVTDFSRLVRSPPLPNTRAGTLPGRVLRRSDRCLHTCRRGAAWPTRMTEVLR